MKSMRLALCRDVPVYLPYFTPPNSKPGTVNSIILNIQKILILFFICILVYLLFLFFVCNFYLDCPFF